jgi:hypothetical protein
MRLPGLQHTGMVRRLNLFSLLAGLGLTIPLFGARPSADLSALDIGMHCIESALLLFEPISAKFVGIIGQITSEAHRLPLPGGQAMAFKPPGKPPVTRYRLPPERVGVRY